jgi:hypothetical protein
VTGTGNEARTWALVGADGRSFASPIPGTLGGHRRTKVYGRLDCPTALRYLARGQYVANRVFFADEATAVAAGYRPCASCLPDAHRRWMAGRP